MRTNNASALAAARAFETQRLRVSMARSPEEVKEAQRLRHRVFVDEMGAPTSSPAARLERDRFDPFCRHLIVRDTLTGRVVGMYRILAPERAAALGSFMAEREFDLAPLAAIRGQIAEVGRACIDARYRRGPTIMLLWSGLAAYALARRLRFLFGCASLSFGANDVDVAAIYDTLAARHLAPAKYRVTPWQPLPRRSPASDPAPHVPVLLKGYLRAGAWICGEPAWDPEFQSADLPVLLPLERIEQRYARHFLHATADPAG